MASPMSPEHTRGDASSTLKRPQWLALTSLLLSLAPLVALGLLRLIPSIGSSLP
jgi:hypothetical protein